MEAKAKGYTMGSFKFYCPHCEQKIEADESMRGEIANCPCCNEEIVVDELSSWKEICKTRDWAGTMVPQKQGKRHVTVKQTPKWQAGNAAKQKTCWRCDGLGRKYTYGGNGEVCHVCNGFGVIHESSDSLYKNPPQYSNPSYSSLYKNPPRHSNPSSDFDSPIVKGGCGFILGLILLCVIVGSCDDKNDRKTTANSGIPTEEELMYPMDGDDPKNWRKHEEDLENRLPHLKNAPYACKRCGMKSDRPLDDPQGVWGRNGVCAYCIDYLHSKR